MPYQQQTKGIFITSVLEDIPYGFTIPKGYYADQNISGKSINGFVIIYNDKDQIFARLSYKNSKLNGPCVFYQNGNPIELITYEEDVKNGWNIFYSKNQECQWVLYKNGKKERILIKHKSLVGYKCEVTLDTGELLTIGEYDKNCVLNGHGFRIKDKKIWGESIYVDGEESYKISEIKGNQIIYYDNNGQMIYEGSYMNDISLHFPRWGFGKEYYDNNVVYEGNWENNKKKGKGSSFYHNTKNYDGEWANDLPNGKGTLFVDGDMRYTGFWSNGLIQLPNNEYYSYSEENRRNGLFESSRGSLTWTGAYYVPPNYPMQGYYIQIPTVQNNYAPFPSPTSPISPRNTSTNNQVSQLSQNSPTSPVSPRNAFSQGQQSHLSQNSPQGQQSHLSQHSPQGQQSHLSQNSPQGQQSHLSQTSQQGQQSHLSQHSQPSSNNNSMMSTESQPQPSSPHHDKPNPQRLSIRPRIVKPSSPSSNPNKGNSLPLPPPQPKKPASLPQPIKPVSKPPLPPPQPKKPVSPPQPNKPVSKPPIKLHPIKINSTPLKPTIVKDAPSPLKPSQDNLSSTNSSHSQQSSSQPSKPPLPIPISTSISTSVLSDMNAKDIIKSQPDESVSVAHLKEPNHKEEEEADDPVDKKTGSSNIADPYAKDLDHQSHIDNNENDDNSGNSGLLPEHNPDMIKEEEKKEEIIIGTLELYLGDDPDVPYPVPQPVPQPIPKPIPQPVSKPTPSSPVTHSTDSTDSSDSTNLIKKKKSSKCLLSWLIGIGLTLLALLIGIIIIWNNASSTPTFTENAVITTATEWKSISKEIKSLTFPDDSCNEGLEMLEISGFQNLQTIRVGINALSTVRFVNISNVPNLLYFIVDSNSFTQSRNTHEYRVNRYFYLTNCENLLNIQIGSFSFSDYSHFYMADLPRLTSLTIGNVIYTSDCFYYANLHLESLSSSNDYLLDIPNLFFFSLAPGCFEESAIPVFNNVHLKNGIEMGEIGVISTFPKILFSLLQVDPPISIKNQVQSISIKENSYNINERLSIRGFPFLTSITIGDNCFKQTRYVNILDLPLLQNLTIASSSFYAYLVNEYPGKENPWTDGEFHLVNCPKLERLIIDRFSFFHYSTFDLQNLPLLRTLMLGSEYTMSGNFYYSSLQLDGFPSIETIIIGQSSFDYGDIYLKDLPLLYELMISDYADLPSLSIVRGYDWCLCNIGNVYIINVMNVTTLDIGPYAFSTLRYRYIVNATKFLEIPALTDPLPDLAYGIFNPFIYGDNTNYESQDTCYEQVISPMKVVENYLDYRRVFTDSLVHTPVLAIMGLSLPAIELFHLTLARYRKVAHPIDLIAYSDPVYDHIYNISFAVPLISLSQYLYPARIILHNGTFYKEGVVDLLEWMVNNRNKGYFRNLLTLQITQHNLGISNNPTNPINNTLDGPIVSYLSTICNDKTNFPRLEFINLNDNAYEGTNGDFRMSLSIACPESSGVTVQSRTIASTVVPLCSTTSMFRYNYFNLSDPKELERCRHTWNWEFGMSEKYTTSGPYPNELTEHCES